MPTLGQIRNRWALQVGRFILAFGDIEQQSFALWRKYFGAEKPPTSFKTRVQKLLGKLKSDPSMPAELGAHFVRALRIADKRNAIAHHPMCLQVFEHVKTGEVFTEWAIRSELAEDYVSEEALAQLLVEARAISKLIHPHVFGSGAQ